MSRLLHYCQFEMTGPIPDYEQPSGILTVVEMKPKGLWVSVEGEDDWKTWCETNRFNLHKFQYCYEIRLIRAAKVLWIKTAPQFKRFNTKYKTDIAFSTMKRPSLGVFDISTGIDWTRVADDYDGIIIAPYQWKFRLECFWYYGWDCASGCLWRNDAIESIDLVTT